MRYAVKLLAIGLGVYLLLAFEIIDSRGLGVAWRYRGELAGLGILYFGTIMLASLRWHIVLRAVNFPLPLLDAIKITMISFFFSSFLPGGASGDGVRGFYLFRYRSLHRQGTNLRRGGAVTGIVADRILGVFGLLLFTCVAIAAGLWMGFGGYMLETIAIQVFILLLVGIACAVAAFAFAASVRRLSESVAWLHSEKFAWAVSLVDALLLLRRNRGAIVAGVVISIVNQVVAVIILWFIMSFLNMGNIGILSFLLAAAVAMTANVLPITPGGIGVAEFAFDQILQTLEPTETAIPFGTAFFVLRLVILSCSLLGAPIFFFYRIETRKPEGSLVDG